MCCLVASAVSSAGAPAVKPSSLDGPLAPDKALDSFRPEPGLRIELVAAEPMIQSPVAIGAQLENTRARPHDTIVNCTVAQSRPCGDGLRSRIGNGDPAPEGAPAAAGFAPAG